MNNDYQRAQDPLIQIFDNQFKCITRKKFGIFVLKVVTLDPHVIFLLTLIIYCTNFKLQSTSTTPVFTQQNAFEKNKN